MMGSIRRSALLAVVIALAAAAIAAPATFAQEYPESGVSVGGAVTGGGHRGSTGIAPGVVISGGTVSNTTGIGVNVGGGSSIGATSGGDDSAAVVQ